MPLLWRKVKGGRISQLVSDHLHNSWKRRDGSPLVVEMGLSTSLVDLFMKNQEKMKKPSKQKRFDKCSVDAEDPLPCLPSPTPSSVHSDTDELPTSEGESKSVLLKSDGVSSNSIFVVAFQMFLVVFLLLGTDKLSIGISISMFLLFFPDHILNSVLAKLTLFLEETGLFWRNPFVLARVRRHILIQSSEDAMPVVECIDSPATPVKEIQASPVIHQKMLEMKQEPKKMSKRGNMKSKLIKLFSKRLPKGSNPQKIEEANQSQNNREPECESPVSGKHEDAVHTNFSESVQVKGAREDASLLLVGFIIVVGLVAANRPFAVLLTVLWCFLLTLGEVLQLSFRSKLMKGRRMTLGTR